MAWKQKNKLLFDTCKNQLGCGAVKEYCDAKNNARSSMMQSIQSRINVLNTIAASSKRIERASVDTVSPN